MGRLNIMKKFLLFFIPFFCLVFIFNSPYAQQEKSIPIEKVAGDVFCLFPIDAGNLGILKGKDDLLIVDSTYARTASDIAAKIKEFSPNKIQYLINTHYHGDHTGGNPVLGKDALIISQTNCKKSLLAGLKPEETPDSVGPPEKTYDKEMALQAGEETVRLLHFGPAHTSGDTVVVFETSKAIHAGDLFFHGFSPYIDVEDGSDTQNWIRTIQTLADKYPDFRVIPGHGAVTDMEAFLKFADYLTYLRAEVSEAIKAGKTREETMESIDFSPFSHIRDLGEFLTKKLNAGWVYDGMTRE